MNVPNVFAIKVHDDGKIEVCKAPSNEPNMGLTVWTEEAPATELRGYGVDHPGIEDAICELGNAETYEWVTVTR